jgi:exonuclease SbcC
MILKRLLIKNFRSHKTTTLNLHPGVNIITGIGLSGKTPIIDAVKWLAFNRPVGDKFKSRFNKKGTTKVSGIFSDGLTATLEKRNNAKYTLSGTVEHTAEAFGASVPEEVSDAINLSSINFAGQFDPPLLVTATPTIIRQTINKITDQEASEGWRAVINKNLTTFKAQLKITEGEVSSTRRRLKKFKVLTYIEQEIEKYKKIVKQINELDEQIELLKEVAIISEKISYIEKTVGYITGLYNQLQIIRSKEEDGWEQIKNLEDLKSKEGSMNQIKRKLKKLNKNYQRLLKGVKLCPTCKEILSSYRMGI